ncbi:MAG: formylglycine-generating enzyme family protein [Candidatus Brocadiia bacterium]
MMNDGCGMVDGRGRKKDRMRCNPRIGLVVTLLAALFAVGCNSRPPEDIVFRNEAITETLSLVDTTVRIFGEVEIAKGGELRLEGISVLDLSDCRKLNVKGRLVLQGTEMRVEGGAYIGGTERYPAVRYSSQDEGTLVSDGGEILLDRARILVSTPHSYSFKLKNELGVFSVLHSEAYGSMLWLSSKADMNIHGSDFCAGQELSFRAHEAEIHLEECKFERSVVSLTGNKVLMTRCDIGFESLIEGSRGTAVLSECIFTSLRCELMESLTLERCVQTPDQFGPWSRVSYNNDFRLRLLAKNLEIKGCMLTSPKAEINFDNADIRDSLLGFGECRGGYRFEERYKFDSLTMERVLLVFAGLPSKVPGCFGTLIPAAKKLSMTDVLYEAEGVDRGDNDHARKLVRAYLYSPWDTIMRYFGDCEGTRWDPVAVELTKPYEDLRLYPFHFAYCCFSCGREITFIVGELQEFLAKTLPGAIRPKAAPQTFSPENAPLPLVAISPGSFMMGSEREETWEQQAHKVTLTKPFYMGAMEVTQAQYRSVMNNNPSEFKGEDLPVESVSWENAVEFCRRLTESERLKNNLPEGIVYRLPTEAEWEYCCRAGSTTDYCFGDNVTQLGDYAWYGGNSEHRTNPVGTKKPNAWGLYDMHGNVLEWCLDWFESYQPGEKPPAVENTIDPVGPATGEYRLLRGGVGNFAALRCRSTSRYRDVPHLRTSYYGFRVVVAAAIEVAGSAPAGK